MLRYCIDVDVKEDDGFCWRFTGVYGEAHKDLKHRVRKQMRDLGAQPKVSWLCVGDFSEILFSHEKEGAG